MQSFTNRQRRDTNADVVDAVLSQTPPVEANRVFQTRADPRSGPRWPRFPRQPEGRFR